MADEFQEYVTFVVKNRDGLDVELAVVDEFDYVHKHYVVGALIEGDVINEDGFFIYKAKLVDDNLVVETIDNMEEYEEIANAYLAMEGDEE